MIIFDYKFPIDIASALTGGFIGLLLVFISDFFTKPRILPFTYKFIKSNFNFGYADYKPSSLYKLKFKIRGFRSPGFCELHIFWYGNHVKAKWDDTPNPLEFDDATSFNAVLVPQTFLNLLMLNQSYTVPIFNIDSEKNITIFDGWWFGKRLTKINKGVGDNYEPNPEINENTEIKIVLKGNGLSWSKKIKIKKIFKKIK